MRMLMPPADSPGALYAPHVSSCPVVVIGAGPTGLLLASELRRHGVEVRIVDKVESPSRITKASQVSSRTLEVFEDIGVLDRALEVGHKVWGATVYAEGGRALRIASDDLDAPYPYVVTMGQQRVEPLLIDHLETAGGTVERGVEVAGIAKTPDGEAVEVSLRHPDGLVEVLQAEWCVGCDGASSATRDLVAATFKGKTYPEDWMIGDVRIDWELSPDETYLFFSKTGAAGFQPLPKDRWLFGGALPLSNESRKGEAPSLDEFQAYFDAHVTIPGVISDPVWTSIYRVHQRSVDRRRNGRILLAGDAAHLSSPAGAIGMNTGLQDAYNLAWKLALIVRGRSDTSLVDSYDAERQSVAKKLLSQSALNHLLQSVRIPILREVRNHMVDLLSSFECVADKSLNDMSQIKWGYRQSPIVAEDFATPLVSDYEGAYTDHGKAIAAWRFFGRGPGPGDRAPDCSQIEDSDGRATRFYEILAGLKHSLIIFLGCTEPAESTLVSAGRLIEFVRSRYDDVIDIHVTWPSHGRPPGLDKDVGLICDPTEALHNRYGARGECLYLIRPDNYVGYRAIPPDVDALEQYLRSIFVAD